MTGNVREWCWDWYAAPPYPAGSAYLGGTNPTGVGPGTGYRVLRGGYWIGPAYNSRCAYRSASATRTTIARSLLGFGVCGGFSFCSFTL